MKEQRDNMNSTDRENTLSKNRSYVMIDNYLMYVGMKVTACIFVSRTVKLN